MAYTTIDDPSEYFHIQLYSGDGNTNRDVTNDANAGDFKPDWLWLKGRTDSSTQHMLFNSNVGMPNHLHADLSDAEQTATNKATVFNADGFRVQDHSQVNGSGKDYVAWQWKCNGGTTSSNSSGSITSTVQVNTTAGFSIVTFTGNGTGGATIGHGLGAVPHMILSKSRGHAENWAVYHQFSNATPEDYYFALDDNRAASDSSVVWNDTAPTSTLVTLGSQDKINKSGSTHIAFCFTEIQGYSKFGSYTGNGSSSDGTFVYLGFKPAFIIIKATDQDEWRMYDNKRSTSSVGGINPINRRLRPHTDQAETTADGSETEMDFLSNGFKLNSTSGGVNTSGQVYTYMTFAEHPFVSSKGVPVTAR